MSEAWDRFVAGLQDALASVGTTLGEWVPKILVAVAVLIIGRWVIAVLRRWVDRVLSSPAATTVYDRAGLTDALEGTERRPGTMIGAVATAFLMLLLWLIVFRILEIDPVVDLLQRLIAVLPLIFVAVALVLIAAAVANFVSDLVRPYAERRQLSWLPTLTRVAIIVFGALAALDLLDIRFAEDLVKIVAAAGGVALAIAFGVGGIDTARQWWTRYLAPRE